MTTKNDWLTGIYLTSAGVLANPDYLRRLRDDLSVDVVVLDYAGQLPQKILDLSPYAGRTPTDDELAELILRHFDGRPIDPREYEQARALCGPGVPKEGDEGVYRRALAQLEEQGFKVWTHGGAWTIRRLMFCPSRPDTRAWLEAVCVHWATQYGFEAVDITHFRYPMGSFPLGLFGCTCSHCHAAAAGLGYDMDAMVADLKSAREGLRRLDGKRLGEVARLGMGLPETVEAFGADDAMLAYRIPTADLIIRDLAKTRMLLPPEVPSYPIIHGSGWGRETIDRILSEARRLGHNGIVWQGTGDLLE